LPEPSSATAPAFHYLLRPCSRAPIRPIGMWGSVIKRLERFMTRLNPNKGFSDIAAMTLRLWYPRGCIFPSRTTRSYLRGESIVTPSYYFKLMKEALCRSNKEKKLYLHHYWLCQ
jgi:hypothetical protein